MRKLFLFLVVLCASFSNAQSNQQKYYAYGVDFSCVKVLGAKDGLLDFAKAFEGINLLLLSEMEKYDFSRMVNKKVVVDVAPMLEKLSECDYEGMKIYRNEYPEIDCSDIIKQYSLLEKEGRGIVLIAKLLDKSSANAIYDVVLFDIASREILFCKEVVGEAGGFGLRNFWAASVYDAIKRTRIKVRH